MDTFLEMQRLAGKMYVKIHFKDESLFMRLLGYLLFFNNGFMTQYTTTIGSTVYFPNRKAVADDPLSLAVVLAHELTHVQDSRDLGMLQFAAMYLFPQCVGLLAFLALLAWPFSLWWLLSLTALVAAYPWRSHGRTWIEYRGYATSLACYNWMGYGITEPPDWVVSNFTDMSYFRMNPDRAEVQQVLRGWLVDSKSGAIITKLPMGQQLMPIFAKVQIG